MPHNNRITNQDPDLQKTIEAQVSEPRNSENQSLDVAVTDHSSEIKHRRLTGLYQVLHPENEVSPCTKESSELTTIAKPAATPYRPSKDSPSSHSRGKWQTHHRDGSVSAWLWRARCAR